MVQQDYDYGSGVSPTPPNSTTAIISLVAGILGLTFLPTIGSIIALITGYMAKNEIRDSHGAVGGEGLATAGLVLGWIGVGLLVLGICAGFCALGLALAGVWSFSSLEEFNFLPALLGWI